MSEAERALDRIATVECSTYRARFSPDQCLSNRRRAYSWCPPDCTEKKNPQRPSTNQTGQAEPGPITSLAAEKKEKEMASKVGTCVCCGRIKLITGLGLCGREYHWLTKARAEDPDLDVQKWIEAQKAELEKKAADSAEPPADGNASNDVEKEEIEESKGTSGRTISRVKEELVEWEACLAAIRTGQDYQVGSRQMKRADLNSVYRIVKDMRRELVTLENGGVRRVVLPLDLDSIEDTKKQDTPDPAWDKHLDEMGGDPDPDPESTETLILKFTGDDRKILEHWRKAAKSDRRTIEDEIITYLEAAGGRISRLERPYLSINDSLIRSRVPHDFGNHS